MPGNLIGSTPNGVMPASLCTAFSELREYAQLQNQFHDGTIQRSQLAQTSRRTFRLSEPFLQNRMLQPLVPEASI
jgi:hypothetical protein